MESDRIHTGVTEYIELDGLATYSAICVRLSLRKIRTLCDNFVNVFEQGRISPPFAGI